MKRIYLIRHAQSEYNEKGIFQGRLDSDLTPLGFVQARLLTGYFKEEKPEIIFQLSPEKSLQDRSNSFGHTRCQPNS